MADLKTLREERGKLISDARAIVDLAETENRGLSAEESAKYDDLFAKADELRDKIDREERLRDAERTLDEVVDATERRGEREKGGDKAAERTFHVFRSWLKSGTVSGDGAEEFRALSAGVATDGGYLVIPEQFVAMLIKAVDDQSIVRSKATVYSLNSAASIGVPTLDTDVSDWDWTTELQTGSEDSSMKFGKRRMMPHPIAKRIKVSRNLLANAALPVETIVRDRLAYKLAATMENAYMTGNGLQRPLGLFTASNDGIPTARDVSTDNTGTSITADGLINAKFSLKAAYWQRAEWIFHRDAVKMIAKLKDGEGQYLWRESIRAGEPDMLLGRPVNMSEFAPNTFTSGLYAGILGDFSHYWILDSLQMQMQRLDELYAESNQVGFIGRYEGDAQPVLAEAFARVKLG